MALRSPETRAMSSPTSSTSETSCVSTAAESESSRSASTRAMLWASIVSDMGGVTSCGLNRRS